MFLPSNKGFYIYYAVRLHNMGLIVKADSSFKSFKDLIDYARQNPKKVTYGTNGVNTAQHLIMELICKKSNIEMTHIPFKGTNESQIAILGGHIMCAVGDFTYSLIESGMLNFSSSFGRRNLQNILRSHPKGLCYEFWEPGFFNVSGPKGMPEGIVEKLEEAFAKAMKEPAFIKAMKELHVPIRYRNSKELKDYAVYNYEYWGKFLKERG